MPPFPQSGGRGGGLQLWKFPPAQMEKGPASQHQGYQMPGVSRSWSINGQERHPSSVSEFCVCASHARSLATFLSARRGPAVDCGTQLESKLRGLLGGQGWLWLDVGHGGSNLTCCPQGWDSSGSLRQLWGGRESHHRCSGTLGSEVITKSLEAQLSSAGPRRD